MEKQQRKKELEKLDKVKIGYARVSTLDQNLGFSVQLDNLKDCDIIFSEKQSGDNDNRPELTKAIRLTKKLASQGKTVTFKIYKLDRLSRKMFTLANLIDDFNKHGIKLISILENIETDSLTGRLLCIVLGYVAEIELENIRIRTKDGLRKARENGVVLGNPGLSKEKENEILQLYQLIDLSISDIAKRVKVSEKTIYNVAKRHNLTRKCRKPVANSSNRG